MMDDRKNKNAEVRQRIADIPSDARSFLKMLLRPHITDGKLLFQQRDIDADRIIYELDIKTVENEFGRVFFDINEEQASHLLIYSLTNVNVAAYGKLIAGTNLEADGPLPSGLRLLASIALTDRLPKGKRGRKRGDNYERDNWICIAVRLLHERYGINKTRSEASLDRDTDTGELFVASPSACDLVAEELRSYGGPGFERVVEIYFEMEKFLKTDRALDPKKEVALALLSGGKK